jgi:hypothetical protein
LDDARGPASRPFFENLPGFSAENILADNCIDVVHECCVLLGNPSGAVNGTGLGVLASKTVSDPPVYGILSARHN